jgi:hypothetical protein
MKHFRYNYLYAFVSIFLFYSCEIDNILDPKFPKWSIDLDVPLLDKTVLLRDNILDIDSSIALYPNMGTESQFDSIFVYKLIEQIDSTFINDKLSIQDVVDTTITQSVDNITVENISFSENINFSNIGIGSVTSELTTEIGLIDLNDINSQSSDPYTFEALLPNFYESIETYMDISDDPDIGNQEYNEEVLGPIDNQEIVPTLQVIQFESFEYANFDSGLMNISIDNTLMYLNYDNILIQIQNANNNDILNTLNIGPMNSGLIYNNSINLGELPNNGFLPNNINIIISGEVVGINPASTYNQLLNSQIGISVTATDLVVKQASAEIPVQTFSDNGSIVLENENKILEATINTGYLDIGMVNNLSENLDGNININIPNILDQNAAPLLISFNLSEDSIEAINLSGYKIVINDIEDQQIFYSYSVSTLDTDQYVLISQSDNITINFSLIGDIIDDSEQITFSTITGIIEDQEHDISGNVDLEVEGATMQNAVFSSGEIKVEIVNNISSAPLSIEVVINEISLDGEPFTQTIMLSGNADETFILDDYILTPTYIDGIPKIAYNAVASSTNSSQNEYNLQEDIMVNLIIQDIVIKEITGYFNQDPIVETNLVSLESDNIIEQGTLESGNIEITINNNLGLLADVSFSISELIDSDGNFFNYTIPLTTEQAIVNIDLSNYSIFLNNDIDSESYQKVSYTSEVIINSEALTTLNLENNIDLRFKIPELNFSYIKGYVAPIEVEITPFSKSDLNILPDDIEGITFNSASAYLDFDSQLDLDLLLQLDFYSINTDSGEEYSFQFIEQTTTSIDKIYLDPDNILDMLNIMPDSLSVSGLATVSGEGEINSTDAIAAEFIIEVPFEFIFTEDTNINVPSTELSEDSIPESFENMTLYYNYQTPFSFNTNLSIYCSDDTTTIIDDANKFIEFDLLASEGSLLDSIEINSDKFNLINSSDFMKPIISIVSQTNENGDFIPHSFFSTDSLNIKIWGKIGLYIDEDE